MSKLRPALLLILAILVLAAVGMRIRAISDRPAVKIPSKPAVVPSQPPAAAAAAAAATGRTISILNGCGATIWFASQANAGVTTKLPALVKIDDGKTYDYKIDSNDGWAGRFWPKIGCDTSGYNCTTGDSIPPCGGGTDAGPCEPPADTKIEFFFAKDGGDKRSYYDVSLVDGYSLPFLIEPSTSDKTCVPTSCSLSLDKCPKDEKYQSTDLGNLAVVNAGKNVQCLSPCKKWNYPAPYGMGQPETTTPGPALCCPSPVTPAACNEAAGVRTTAYAKLVHETCRSAYAFSYDDAAGSHDCPSTASFKVYLCAQPAAH